MADQSTNIIYTFEDIQRYISGKMSATEMHAIEKAALQDAFLADAIEGFTNADETVSAQHINELNASLFKEEKESLLLSLKRKTNWWRIAAVIILIFGIGVLSDYVFKRMDTHQQIAQVKANDTNNLKPSTNNNIESDSTAIQPSSLGEPELEKKLVAKSKANSSANTKTKTQNDVAMNNNSAALSRQKEILKDETVSIQAQKLNTEADKNYSFSPMAAAKPDSIQQQLQGRIAGIEITQTPVNGKVVDDENQPVAFAVISENKTKRLTTTDVNGNFKIAINDTNNVVTASQPGYETKKIRLQEDANNKIVLNKTDNNLNEVVVVGLGVKKAKKSKTAVPVGGWNDFNNYVVEELGKDSLFQKSYANDFVEIEFLIDDDGNPYSLKIIKPLDEKSNQKALDILSSGPKWTTTSKQKKAKVKINF